MGEEGGDRPLFVFSAEDVLACRAVGREESDYSEFDRLLLSSWDQAMCEGVFRYDLSDVVTRTVPGRYGIIAMNNPKRFSHRRPPADLRSLLQPFDPSQFNFNRIKRQEILFEVSRKTRQGNEKEKRHMVLVNVSPIDRGHVLLVPEPASCLPQVMTQDSLQLCLELITLSGHSGFCMVANSLLAYATVNHLHYHFMYTQHQVLASTVGGRCLVGGCYELTGHYSRGFGFSLDSTADDCSSLIFRVISLLLEWGIPHNVVMLRGTPFSAGCASHTPDHTPSHTHRTTVIRTLLIPRKPALGFQKLYKQDRPPPLFAASSELGLGLIPVLDRDNYFSFSEEDFLSILREQVLSENEFCSLKTKLISELTATL